MARTIRAGTAITDISPKPGVSLGGYPHHPRPNAGVHDPLYASCIYLDDGTTRLAIVGMDLLQLSKRHVQEVRERVADSTDIPAAHIMICCSHSHSSPRGAANFTMDAFETGQDPEASYVAVVKDKLAELVTAAAADPFEARIAVDKGYCGREDGVGGNRRDQKGIADPEVWCVGVQDASGSWRAVLVKYALHPTFLHSDNSLASADYPGYIRAHLAATRPETVMIFTQGTSGNQSPRYFRSGKTFAEAERVGSAIGREVNRVLDLTEPSADCPLVVRSGLVDVELRRLPSRGEAEARAEEARRAWHAMREARAAETDVWNAELRFLGAEDTLSLVLLQEEGTNATLRDDLPVEVQVLGIGDARIVGIQGELFVEFGITIQYRAPFTKCFVVELANGVLPGYAATARAYATGGYETGASMLTGHSGEQLVEEAVRLLHETREGESQ